MEKPREINSPIFGKTYFASDEATIEIEKHVQDTPLSVFAALNKKFNKNGFCITIMTKEEMQ